MTESDVRVRRLEISARSSRPALAVSAMRTAEQALRRALGALPSNDELVLIRRVDISVRGTVSGPLELEAALARRLREILREHTREGARRDDRERKVFSSLPVALAEHLVALSESGRREWYHAPLGFFGETLARSLDYAIRSGAAFSGDVLAELARRGDVALLAHTELVPSRPRLEALWFASAPLAFTSLGALPEAILEDVRERLAAAFERDLEVSTGLGRLLVLAELFARWPPLRGAELRREEIDAFMTSALPRARVEQRLSREATREQGQAAAEAETSRAGGLVYWAKLLVDLFGDLEASLREPRVFEAVRWAIARSLEDPALAARDPLLVAFTGADAGAVLTPSQALAERDSAALARLAFGVARSRSASSRSIHLAPWGDRVLAYDEDSIVDLLPTGSVHDAVTLLVRRLRGQGTSDFPALEIDSRVPDEIADVVVELDVPSLPDAWRGSVLAVTSCLRREAAQRHRARVRDLRGWSARLRADGDVELPVRLVENVAGGTWFGDGRVLLGRRLVQARRASF